MASPVKLYVYDLSNGMAARLSLQLTGRQINGIWHTSVVVYGREVFFTGQGIAMTHPGKSHYGQPLQVLEMGDTLLDQETFNDYIQEIRNVYSGDKYHLLDFNCNSFTEDVVAFLTGRSIPAWIKDLPADFLSTPLGAALRPTIDSMFRRPVEGTIPTTRDTPTQPVASSIPENVVSQASGPARYIPPSQESETLTAPIQICSNASHFDTILKGHKAVTFFFTSQTCPPCRMIEPVFENIADNKATNGVAFVKVDLGGMLMAPIANKYSVRATPTFLFFLNGSKVHELKGADAGELRTQVDLLIYQAFPPHPHSSKSYPAIRAISLDPILFTQVPPLPKLYAKLASSIDLAAETPSFKEADKAKTKEVISKYFVPFLSSRFVEKKTSTSISNGILVELLKATALLFGVLQENELFPLVDMWRLALLDKSVSSWCSSSSASGLPVDSRERSLTDLVELVLKRVATIQESASKNLLLTTFRFLCNTFSDVTLARSILSGRTTTASSVSKKQLLTSLLVPSMLHTDPTVRTAAACLAFNIAAHYQVPRAEAVRSGLRGEPSKESDSDGEWEVEIASAIVEALRTEHSNEDALHRLVASLALLLFLSPFFESELRPLLEVLQVKDILSAKLAAGDEGFGESGVTRPEVRTLILETMTLMS